MLDGTDKQTAHALRLLTDTVCQSKKPFVFWLGAGSSAWCDYPLWSELADILHSKYLRYESGYDQIAANRAIELKNYPEVFQQCKDLNKQRYFSILAESLGPRKITPVYQRLIAALAAINPLNIVTTNVDESLEKNLSSISTLQRTNLERCTELLTRKESFVCKLHGSISAIETAVFSSEDYKRLLEDLRFLELLRLMFAEVSVVFLGYGLADKYILDQISHVAELKSIFGDGPHFAIMPLGASVPLNVNPIRYIPEPDKDHRSAIQVIEEIRIYQGSRVAASSSQFEALKAQNIHSGHLLSTLYPPGRYKTTKSATFTNGQRIVYGEGLTEAEIPSTISTAMHDLMVGLLCFDTVYAYVSSVGALHNLIGTRSLTDLLACDALTLVLMPTQDVILYKSASEANGSLNSIYFGSEIGSESEKSGSELFDQQIRRILKPLPGVSAEEIDEFYGLIKSRSLFYDRQTEPNIKGIVGGLLLRTSLRSLLGMSGGTSLDSLPEWMIYPVLRLAWVVRTGVTCQLLGIASAKLEYGESKLAGPAFAASSGQEWADGMASYVMTGRFDSDLGTYDIRNPTALDAILKFRDSPHGIALRKEILEKLSLPLGGDVVASINAALKGAIPSSVLQHAHDQMAGLLIAGAAISTMTPALWNNAAYADKALELWRQRSGATLEEHCVTQGVKMRDRCPCGSGEKLMFCCAESLNVLVH